MSAIYADFDGFWWVRTSAELAGPYDTKAIAQLEHPACFTCEDASTVRGVPCIDCSSAD